MGICQVEGFDPPILFLHGLESGPMGTKAVHLRTRWGGGAVDLDTRKAIASRNRSLATGSVWNLCASDMEEALATPLERARDAIAAKPPHLIVGSSFGGAVLLILAQEGLWTGPSLFLASAGCKLTPYRALPQGHRAILIHGRNDDVVSIEDSRTLARNSGAQVQVWEVGDGHRLSSILIDGTLDAAIGLLLGRGSKPST